MKPKIFQNCSLYTWDRITCEFGTIDPNLVYVKFIDGIAYYYPVDKNLNVIIVQALNLKKASAKILTLINIEKKWQEQKH